MPVSVSPDGRELVFELADRARRLAGVRLIEELGLGGPLPLTRTPNGWRLTLARPDVLRMEYLFEIEDHNGRRNTVPDPDNPQRAGGAFGDKSVAEFPGYAPPAWLAADAVPGRTETIEVETAELDAPVTATIWAPESLDAGTPAPAVLVHDGPEYARLGRLTDYLGVLIAQEVVPPLRAVLLDPGDRNEWYAANPHYAAALTGPVFAALPPATARIGVGVSLGALAMLHAHRSHPGTFDALLLQSGSFFTPELDPQESGFSRFAEVTGFVAEVTGAVDDPAPVPVVITCGTVEENLANNEAIAEQLRRLGYPVTFIRDRDAHNYTAWRDALHPHLARLIEAATRAA
jgi:enterochelin esterase family protein